MLVPAVDPIAILVVEPAAPAVPNLIVLVLVDAVTPLEMSTSCVPVD